VAVVGGRVFANLVRRRPQYQADRAWGFAQLDRLLAEWGPFCVVTGGAPGADRLAEDWALARGLACEVHRADWEHLGKRAGPVRNKIIVGRAHRLVALWNMRSTGTGGAVGLARAKGIPVTILNYEERLAA
jgi:hypothetical protein